MLRRERYTSVMHPNWPGQINKLERRALHERLARTIYQNFQRPACCTPSSSLLSPPPPPQRMPNGFTLTQLQPPRNHSSVLYSTTFTNLSVMAIDCSSVPALTSDIIDLRFEDTSFTFSRDSSSSRHAAGNLYGRLLPWQRGAVPWVFYYLLGVKSALHQALVPECVPCQCIHFTPAPLEGVQMWNSCFVIVSRSAILYENTWEEWNSYMNVDPTRENMLFPSIPKSSRAESCWIKH